MCVIAYKAKNVKFPSKSRIREMWEANSDGAGIMWRGNEDNKIYFVKGFMQLKKLEKWIKKNRKWLNDVECALHFRITTHGGTMEGNCHPFVCDINTDSHLLSGSADCVLMHNGVLPVIPRSKDISDSAELALRIGSFEDPMLAMDCIGEFVSASNRVIVMSKNDTKFYGGKWVSVEDDGILYSNDYFNYKSWGIGSVFTSAGKKTDYKHYNVVFDEKLGEFVDSINRKVIPLDEIDPDTLSYEDWEIYNEAKYNGGVVDTGIYIDDENKDILDEELLAKEAEYYGMTKEEYREYAIGR